MKDWKPYLFLLITTVGGIISGVDMIQRDKKMDELGAKLDLINEYHAKEKNHEQN